MTSTAHDRPYPRGLRLVVALLPIAVVLACSSDDDATTSSPPTETPSLVTTTTERPSTTEDASPTTQARPARATTSTLPTPVEVPGTALSGDGAFLGPVLTVPVGGITMSYRQFGTGPDLLLLPAQGGMNLWPTSMLAALAADHRVTMFDNRAVGYTSDAGGPFTYDDLAGDVAGLISALGLSRPAALGWSTGGEVGLVLAASHPDALSSLVVTGATAAGPGTTPPSADIIECFALDDVPCDVLSMMFSATQAGSEALGRWAAELTPAPAPAAGVNRRYTDAAQAYWAEDLDHRAITIPVLVMGGQGDPIAPPANVTFLAEQIRGAETYLDPGGLHGWFIEHPDRFFAEVADFLRDR